MAIKIKHLHMQLRVSVRKHTWSSWILFRSLCSPIRECMRDSCSSSVWKRMKTLNRSYIAFSSGLKSFSNELGKSKFLSNMKVFLRFLSSSLQIIITLVHYCCISIIKHLIGIKKLTNHTIIHIWCMQIAK